jgi:hypothetical protein
LVVTQRKAAEETRALFPQLKQKIQEASTKLGSYMVSLQFLPIFSLHSSSIMSQPLEYSCKLMVIAAGRNQIIWRANRLRRDRKGGRGHKSSQAGA